MISEFETCDPDAASEFATAVFGAKVQLAQPEHGTFRLGTTSFADAGLRIDRFAFSSTLRADAPGFDVLLLHHLLSGGYDWKVERGSGDGTVPFIFPMHRPVDVLIDDTDTQVFSIEADELLAFARQLHGTDRLRLTLTDDGVSAASRNVGYLTSFLQHLRAQAHAGVFDESPLLLVEARRHLSMVVLDSFDIVEVGEPDGLDIERRAPAALRRAIAFIDEHASEPISVEDIAAAAGMSTRGIQTAFQRVFGMTPTARLRAARLDRVRAELLAADPTQGATVADIARRWGFAHVGRFAATYRQAFGENPSATLDR